MFERILTATDMLDACDAAVVNALEIAKQNKGRLFVLHVLEPTYFNECGPVESIRDFKTGEETVATKEYKEKVKEELDNKCEGALKPYGNYQIDLAYGKPSIEIRRWARKFGANLIVLGPHAGKIEEEKELIGIPIGNTVEDVIMHTTTPVMIVGRFLPKERLNFKKIMVCIDFSRSCKYACEFAAKLAQRYGSKLFLFHMITLHPSGKYTQTELEKEITTAKEKLLEFCRVPEGIDHEYIIREATLPHLEILKYASETDVDLIVMGSHTREKGEKWYVGSAVEMVSAECFCPVAVITHPDALLKMKS
ncbi:MAG: universal stress protein [Nitrospirae bacterium]|jgi:nucleotide-binding universal stress UspA family protein|nr:universal stress protein [Nitrospirota bacterium]